MREDKLNYFLLNYVKMCSVSEGGEREDKMKNARVHVG